MRGNVAEQLYDKMFKLAGRSNKGMDWSQQGMFRGLFAQAEQKPKPDYGLRVNGTPKGLGFFGELKGPDGKVSTEISIGINLGGKETQIPTLVPTLDQNEINYLLNGGKPTKEIIDKAVAHAQKRIAEGKNPFAQEGEQQRWP